MSAFHKAMKLVGSSLPRLELGGFYGKTSELAVWKCMQQLVLY